MNNDQELDNQLNLIGFIIMAICSIVFTIFAVYVYLLNDPSLKIGLFVIICTDIGITASAIHSLYEWRKKRNKPKISDAERRKNLKVHVECCIRCGKYYGLIHDRNSSVIGCKMCGIEFELNKFTDLNEIKTGGKISK